MFDVCRRLRAHKHSHSREHHQRVLNNYIYILGFHPQIEFIAKRAIHFDRIENKTEIAPDQRTNNMHEKRKERKEEEKKNKKHSSIEWSINDVIYDFMVNCSRCTVAPAKPMYKKKKTPNNSICVCRARRYLRN